MSGTLRDGGAWWRSRRLRLFLVVGLLLSLLAWVAVDVWAGRRVNAEYARLEKKYGSLDGRFSVAPSVPDNDNRARFVKAASLVVVLPQHTTYSSLMASLAQFEKLPASSPVPDDLRALVDANTEAIRIAGQARSRHQSSWEANYASGGNVPSLLSIRTLGNAVYAAALADLRAGRADDAAAKLATGLAVSASLRQEPFLIGQLIRIAVAIQQCEGVKRLLSQAEPSKAALEDLAAWLAENRSPDPIQIGMLAELRQGNQTWLGMERAPMTRFARPYLRLARLHYMQEMQRILRLQSGPRPHPQFAPFSRPRFWDTRRLTDAFTRGLERSIDSGDRFTSVRGTTQLGVALRRYRLDHATYPDALGALVPGYLPWLPDDPATGQPPVYARSGAGFTLKAAPVDTGAARSAVEWSVPR